jgi:hypothetical protein
MRKIYQSAPDVPQAIANKAVDIIERHFATEGARRAEDLPEESRIHLLRELQRCFQSELPARVRMRNGEPIYDWGSRRSEGFLNNLLRRLQRALRGDEADIPP